MELNNHLLNIFRQLGDLKNVSPYLKIQNEKAIISINRSTLFHLDSNSMFLENRINLQHHLSFHYGINSENYLKELNSFLDSVSKNILRLNHIGIAYFCKNINEEIDNFKRHLRESNFKIYEEDSQINLEKWIFIGDITDWKNPLFEFVLIESDSLKLNQFVPHFQIDLDTDLSSKEIDLLTNDLIKPKFIDWRLDILDYGNVLNMGTVANFNSVKIRLGLGTNIRNTEYHRKKILKEIKFI